MISFQEHLSRIVDTVQRLPPTGLDLLDAQGCVLAQDVRSEVALPGFRNSAMDGYAVRAADLSTASPGEPVTLPVVHDIAAGSTRALSLAAGQSMRIMTGAPMPAGADAVVPVELTDGGLGSVPGTAIAALVLATVEVFSILWLPSYLTAAVGFVLLVLVLVARPGGLFGQKVLG